MIRVLQHKTASHVGAGVPGKLPSGLISKRLTTVPFEDLRRKIEDRNSLFRHSLSAAWNGDLGSTGRRYGFGLRDGDDWSQGSKAS